MFKHWLMKLVSTSASPLWSFMETSCFFCASCHWKSIKSNVYCYMVWICICLRGVSLRSVKSIPNLYGPLSPAPVESNGVFHFLLYAKQVGDVLQLILSQSCCTLCLHSDCKVSAQNKSRTCMENYLGSCFGSSTVYKSAGSCLRDRCTSLKKEMVCCHLFMSTRIHFKPFLVGREPNLRLLPSWR